MNTCFGVITLLVGLLMKILFNLSGKKGTESTQPSGSRRASVTFVKFQVKQ